MFIVLFSSLIFLSSAHEVPAASNSESAIEHEKHRGEPEHKHQEKGAHPQKIFVLGNYHSSSILDTIPTVSTLEGEALIRRRNTSLGETLKNEVGITSTGYGPTASRPVIRGMDGDRIRILQNGIGVLDASGASQDHAVPLDPISAESIEVVRGPITLLYGSSAVGGVVNVTNSRIHEEYTDGFSGVVDAQGSSVNNGKALAAKGDFGVGQHFMFHLDGSFNKTDDLKAPGFAHSKNLRTSTPSTPEPRDKVPNSASEINTVAGGVTYTSDKGYLGVSASTFDNHYGVVVEEQVAIVMKQQRYDIAGELRDVGMFKAVRLKSALSIYKHVEVEEGAPGTTFKNTGNETRLELVQKEQGNLSGILGLQMNTFDFSALGEEAFLPKTKNLSSAVFAFEELDLKPFKWNFGGRGEFSHVKSVADAKFTNADTKSFATQSLSTGLLYSITETLSTALNLSYNERAPNYQELFAGGAHLATFTYQQGDVNLKKESSMAAEVSLRHQSQGLTGSLNFFGQRFNHYIALTPTGQFDDTDGSGTAGDSTEDLPIYSYLAQEANIYGTELDLHIGIPNAALPGSLTLQVKGDYLRGKNRVTGANLPRMTPPRASVGFLHKYNKLTTDAELQQVFQQTKTAPNETSTDAYLLTNAGLSYKMGNGNSEISVFGRVNNIFNVEARNHVSFLKDYTQVGGRNMVVGVRGYF
jgi:iron complex outermembrane recepter protein